MSEGIEKKIKLYRILTGLAFALIILAYFLPVWWTALQSHQYPKSMYPKGIRINFKFSGVYNGCEGVQEREELASNQAGSDCLAEMNAINHYIGMYKITQGRNTDPEREYPVYYVFDVERDADGNTIIDPDTAKPKKINVTPGYLKFLDSMLVWSPYLLGLLAVMILYFLFTPKRLNAIFAIIPALLPGYFLSLYIASLYWYGHNLSLHGGGAFEGIKPFMPTVFGEGKVAQFTTQSYPYIGFFVIVAVAILLFLSVLIKKKTIIEK
ncbi:MAG: hypothetical protein B6244_03635 [Candidatus Cloacimonetes bacterium 4572_55]|nr:MAG: hypothetical protein B6244_03635 [Candidatus Cloacimonetes bacterium 4572_55]